MGASNTKSTQEQLFTPEQLGLIEQLTQLGLKPIRFPQGTGVPGASPLQTLGFERAAGFGSTPTDIVRTAALSRQLSGDPSFEIDPAAREQFLQEGFVAPGVRDFQQQILPEIAERFAGRGLTRSGDFQRAALEAGTNLATNLSAQRSNLIREDTLAERQAAETAAGRSLQALPFSLQESLRSIDVPLNAGTVQRGVTAQQDAAQFQKQLLQLNPQLSPALSLVNAGLAPQFGIGSKRSAGGVLVS